MSGLSAHLRAYRDIDPIVFMANYISFFLIKKSRDGFMVARFRPHGQTTLFIADGKNLSFTGTPADKYQEKCWFNRIVQVGVSERQTGNFGT